MWALTYSERRTNSPPLFGLRSVTADVSHCLLQAEWVALNYVPFAERSLEVVVDLYQKTACHKAVISEKVLQNIVKVSSEFKFVYLSNAQYNRQAVTAGNDTFVSQALLNMSSVISGLKCGNL